MPLLRPTILATALTLAAVASGGIPALHRYGSGAAEAGDFGTCAGGPCIRQAATHPKKPSVLRPHG